MNTCTHCVCKTIHTYGVTYYVPRGSVYRSSILIAADLLIQSSTCDDGANLGVESRRAIEPLTFTSNSKQYRDAEDTVDVFANH